MATGGTSGTLEKENANFFRCSSLLLDLGAEVLREVFRTYYKPNSLKSYFATNKVTIDHLAKGKHPILRPEQRSLLFPPTSAPNDALFDITLLVCLLRNLNQNVPSNHRFWTNPGPSDLSIEADVGRIRDARNQLHAHAKSITMTDQQFNQEKTQLDKIYVRLVNNIGSTTLTQTVVEDKIQKLTHEPLERGRHEALLTLLDSWYRLDVPQEITVLRDEVSNIRHDQQEQHTWHKEKYGRLMEKYDEMGQTLKLLMEEKKRSEPTVDVQKMERRVVVPPPMVDLPEPSQPTELQLTNSQENYIKQDILNMESTHTTNTSKPTMNFYNSSVTMNFHNS